MSAQELVDIVDRDNNVTDTVTRKEMRQKQLPHRASYIAVCNSVGKFLVEIRTLCNDLKGMNALTEEMNNALGEKPKVDLSKYKIGDYVNYTYDIDSASSSYTLESKYSGYSSNQTIAQTTW